MKKISLLIFIVCLNLFICGSVFSVNAEEIDYTGFEDKKDVEYADINTQLEIKLEKLRRILGSHKITRKILESPSLFFFSNKTEKTGEIKLPSDKNVNIGTWLPNEVNVLVLGLDRRINWKKCHADAIHLFTLNTINKTLTITTVPRGTSRARIPGHPGKYVAQAYYHGGRKLMKKIIGKFLKKKIDYVVEFDFARAMRFLELLGYKGKTTLRFLRHRKSYGPGDFQRCHNQALFMKKQIKRLIPYLGRTGGEILFRTAYNVVWTDMAYGMARRCVINMMENEFHKDDSRIILKMKPDFRGRLKEDEIPAGISMDEKVKKQYNSINGSEKDRSRKFSMFDYLTGEINKNRNSSDSEIIKNFKELYEKKLWFQIDEISLRRHVHREISEMLSSAYLNTGQKFLARKVIEEFELSYDLKNVWQLPDEDEIARKKNGEIELKK